MGFWGWRTFFFFYGNQATYLAKWTIPKGTQYLVGKIAGSAIGAMQYFVGNAGVLILI
jgi:hypothetical protein